MQNHSEHKMGSDNSSYTCPMHPEIHRDQPGICPLCGMNLIPEKINKNLKNKSEHQEQFNKHAGHDLATFARKFWN